MAEREVWLLPCQADGWPVGGAEVRYFTAITAALRAMEKEGACWAHGALAWFVDPAGEELPAADQVWRWKTPPRSGPGRRVWPRRMTRTNLPKGNEGDK